MNTEKFKEVTSTIDGEDLTDLWADLYQEETRVMFRALENC